MVKLLYVIDSCYELVKDDGMNSGVEKIEILSIITEEFEKMNVLCLGAD